MTISVFLSGSQTLERHNNYYIESMPGSYRSITSTLEKTSPDNAKADLSAVSESQEEEMEPSRECQDGKWTLQQNMKFSVFVNYHEAIFASKRKRKLCKIFKSLSEYLETRNPTQCRSHFQKMIAKHKSITRMKKYFKGLLGTQNYLKHLSQFKLKWEENHQPLSLIYPELKETKEVAIQTDDPRPEPTVCVQCVRVDEARRAVNPNPTPNQINPFFYWLNAHHHPGMYSQHYTGWMPGVNPFGMHDS